MRSKAVSGGQAGCAADGIADAVKNTLNAHAKLENNRTYAPIRLI
jgi:hypothetical protein